MHRTRLALLACLPLACLAAAGPLPARTEALDPEALVARERLRTEVQTQLLRIQEPIADADVGHMTFLDTVWTLAGLGPDAVPLLIEELEQEEVATYVAVAYALGLLPTPETEKALREAMERADGVQGSFAWARKGWAGIGLAMQRVEDAVDVAQAGQRPVFSYSVLRRTSLLEYAAVMTEPHSLAPLLKQFDEYEHEEPTGERPVRLRYVLRALGWLASPEAVPRIGRVFDRKDSTLRVEAALALSTIDSPESVRLLVAALSDPDHIVRRVAARSLEKLRPSGKLSVWKKRLEEEQDPVARAPLYRLVALDAGRDAGKKLASYAWSDSSQDRLQLVRALGLADCETALAPLGEAVLDPSAAVAVTALTALHSMSTPGAADLLRKGLDAPNPEVAVRAASYVAEAGDREAAGRVAALLARELDPALTKRPGRHRIEALGDAFVRLDGKAGEELRGRIEGFADPGSWDYRTGLLRRLDALAEHGADVEGWVSAAASPHREVRMLAYRKLGEIGDEKASAALVSAFGRVDPEEGTAIIDALAGIDSEQAAETIERVLVDPAFDHPHRTPLRHAAAWAARRKGMTEVLVRAIERRDGQDVWPMIYLAVLEGEDALPVLAKYRIPRLRHLSPRRGPEQERLDWIAREIRRGRSPDSLDIPPDDGIFTVPF